MSLPRFASSPRTDRARADQGGSTTLMQRVVRGALLCLLSIPLAAMPRPVVTAAATVEVLQSTGGIPAFLAGEFEEAAGFALRPDGTALVFDRRRHRVYAVDAARTQVTPLVEIGEEVGRVLRPTSFDVASSGDFIVADAPGRQPRVTVFEARGSALSTFSVAASTTPRVAVDNLVLDGIAAARYTGTTVLINRPEAGALVAEYSVTGSLLRQYGVLRRTGFESDADVHLAFNSALPIPAPDGGVYVVFLAGPPAFRKYSAGGTLEFERVIQGREIRRARHGTSDAVAEAPRG